MIKLGIIGSSDGNGHPYSWSAIFNGYDREKIQNCGYPVIPQYLEKRNYPDEYLCHLAKVDGIWTQEIVQSNHIAKSTLIPNVYTNLSDLIRNVDAVLLARDDSENHLQFLKEISKYRRPVYIDKPIATNEQSLIQIIDLISDSSKFFSCSAFRFHPKLKELSSIIEQNPRDVRIKGVIPKSWEKYSVHLLDPMVQLLPANLSLLRSERREFRGVGVNVKFFFERNITANITTTGKAEGDISFSVKIYDETYNIDFGDTFFFFRAALNHFIEDYVSNSSKKCLLKYHKLVKLIACGIS